ncbi:MAG: D-aminoacylase [Armatimonadetes bacterium]|nr:D-aminoacylase [Armatimonadota bacterium]
MTDRYDILIQGGTVFDGLGGPGKRADVGIRDDRIAAVGDLTGAHAGRVLEARNRYVAPGFIDIHTHSDLSVLINQRMESSVHQGVTTEVTGNCGMSVGLVLDSPLFGLERRFMTEKATWHGSLSGHLRRVEDQGVAINYITLAGHGTIRKRVMGFDGRKPSDRELDEMKALLDQAMEEGAFGLSTGLEYAAGSFAKLPELIALSQVAARQGGFYASHLRNEGDFLVESVQEALTIGEEAGLPVQLSHHKAEGVRNWGKIHATLGMVDRARAAGLDVACDQYPYTAFMTGLSVVTLPSWAHEGGTEAMITRLEDPTTRAHIVAEIRRIHPELSDLSEDSAWHRIEIGACYGCRDLEGKRISDLAAQSDKDPIETALDLLLINPRSTISVIYFSMSEEDVRQVMRYPHTMIGSDGVSASPHGVQGRHQVHPRAYGTFPRVLGRYVREQGLLTWEEAIRKMTSMPARRLGLADRGRLEAGSFADIVVFDPERVQDRASFQDAHHFAEGVSHVLVNGRIALEDGNQTETLAGRVLRAG